MKQILFATCIFLLISCTKFTSNTAAISSKTKIELSSIYNDTSYTYVKEKWHITSNNLDTIISNYGEKAVVMSDSGNFHLQCYRVGINLLDTTTISTYYDTAFNIGSHKVYSIFTVSKNAPFTVTGQPLVIEETDFALAATGYAKVRFIIGVPTTGQGGVNNAQQQMIPRVTLNSSNYQISLASRYYLDNISNPSLLQFNTIPAGTYTEADIMTSRPGPTYTFENGKKYTVFVTSMQRDQNYSMDHLKVIEHSF